jgi:hypothetical protein
MTDHDIVVAGASAPAAQLPEVQLSTTLKLSDEQRAKALAAKAAYISAGLMTAEWIRRMRDLRDSLTSNGSGQTGWGRICEDDFGCDRNHANRMINGYEALFPEGTGLPQGEPIKLREIAPSHFAEIGDHPPEVRMNLAALVREGQLRLNKRAINAKAKELKSQAAKVGLGVSPPKAPGKGVAPVLPTGSTPRADNRAAKELSISKHGNLVPRGEDGRPDPSKPPLRETELAYLRGNTSANVTMGDKLATALKTSRCGKVARIRALAEALHREFKSMGDRYHGAWDSDCDYPSYMHLWQHIWAEEEGYELHNELEAVRKDIAEANRFFGIALMHLYTEGLEVTE